MNLWTMSTHCRQVGSVSNNTKARSTHLNDVERAFFIRFFEVKRRSSRLEAAPDFCVLSQRAVVADIHIKSAVICFTVLTDRSCMPFGSYQDYIGIVRICVDLICTFVADQHTMRDCVVTGELCDTHRNKPGGIITFNPNTICCSFRVFMGLS